MSEVVKRVDALERVLRRHDFDLALENAVVNPVMAIVTENLAVGGTFQRQERFLSDFLPLLARESFVRSLSIIARTSSVEYVSPRSDSSSLARMSSYKLALYSFSAIFSQSEVSRKTAEARPFCVRKIGRCVWRWRSWHFSRLRNSPRSFRPISGMSWYLFEAF